MRQIAATKAMDNRMGIKALIMARKGVPKLLLES
jgi:hypothetical protein